MDPERYVEAQVNLKEGDRVTYLPKNEKGIVKSFSLSEHFVFVVYHCGDDWDNYQNYTAARTNKSDLQKGW